MASNSFFESLGRLVPAKLPDWFSFMRQNRLLHELESLPVSQHWDSIESPLLSRHRGELSTLHKPNMLSVSNSSSRPWTRLEMDRLITLYREMPLWSYWDIAVQLMHSDSLPAEAEPWSPEDCARRLHVLYDLAPEKFGAALPPTAIKHLNAVHTTGVPDIDPIVTDLQPTLCNECTALDLGLAHMKAMLDFNDFWSGPCTNRHPASRSIRALKESADYGCPCCTSMYNAAIVYKTRTSPLMRQVFEDLQTRLAFTRASGEHFVVIKAATTTPQEIARLRLAHLDDWLSFRCMADSLIPIPYCTFAHLVPKAPELVNIAARIRHWLTDCELRHPNCPKSHVIEAPLPARVLLIREKDNEVVIQTKDDPGQHGRYVALSYVWGSSGQFCLTTETEQRLRNGIHVTELAKTIREAVELTHALGLNYIWIDALCIKQDSASDWETQSSQMAQIYSDSELTLIAARSSGVETGFLKPTTPCAAYCGSVNYQGTHKPVFLTHGHDSASIMAPDPLALRAWTLQEEYLSKRRVKFTSRQMEWHCPSERIEEQERDTAYYPSSEQSSFLDFSGDDLFKWKDVVRDYAARLLTVQSDRLPGLSGLASLYAAQNNREYLAGFWSGPYLFDLLLWFRTTESAEHTITKERTGYLAPSWSWAAVNAPVDFKSWIGLNTTHSHVSTVLNCSVMLKGSNAFGEVTDGHLDLSAPVVTTTIATIITINGHNSSSKSRRNNSLLLEKLFPEHVMEPLFADWTWPRFRLDYNDYSDDLVVYCVVLGHEWWGEDDYGMYGILVKPTSLDDRTFRRIGMFDLLPKFRQSDRELDMQELITRQEISQRRYTERHAWIQTELLSGADLDSSPEYEDAVREVAEFKSELRNKAQTMRLDIDFLYFQIL